MKSSSPRTALTGVPSGAVTLSGTPKKARKYSEAVSSRSRRALGRGHAQEPGGPAPEIGTAAGAAVPYARRVEKIDRQILGLLAEDGRMSYTDLGKATGLST